MPFRNLLLQFFGDARDKLRRDLHAIDLFDVLFNLAGGHPTCIERDDSFAKVSHRGLALGDDLRLEAAVAVAWRCNADFPEIAQYRFGCGAVAGVAAAVALRIVFGIAEVLFQLEFQEGLERVLH